MVKNIAAVIADVGDVSEEALTLNRNEVNKQTNKHTNKQTNKQTIIFTFQVSQVFFLSLETILKEKNQRFTIFKNFRYFGMPVFLGGPRHIWGVTGTILDIVLEMILPPQLEYRPIRSRHWDK